MIQTCISLRNRWHAQVCCARACSLVVESMEVQVHEYNETTFVSHDRAGIRTNKKAVIKYLASTLTFHTHSLLMALATLRNKRPSTLNFSHF